MKINKNNYEAFFLDYHEGNLSTEKVAELMLFLEQNPELKEEFEGFESISLNDSDEKISFSEKDELKQNAAEKLFSAYVDGTLSAKEEKELFALLETNSVLKKDFEMFKKTKLSPEIISFEGKENLKKVNVEEIFSKYVDGTLIKQEKNKLLALAENNMQLQKELSLYQKTKLSPDFSIIFENKESLKKKERTGIVISLYQYIAVAASIALVIALYFLIGNKNNSEAQRFAYQRKPGYIIHKNETVPVNENNNQVANSNNEQKKIVSPVYVKTNKIKKQNEENKNDIQIVQQPEKKKDWEDTLKQKQVIATNSFNLVDKNFFNDVNEPEPQQPNSSNYMSVKELVAQNVKTKLLGEELSQDPNEPVKKISWYNVGQLAAKGIRKLTGKDVKLQKEYDSNGDVIAYQFVNGDKTYSLPASK